jgi:hypothetical protein
MRAVTYFIALVFILTPVISEAQFRDQDSNPYEVTGQITDTPASDQVLGLFDFKMDHSYEMTIGSFAGETYNQNFYTNTMHFLFNENLTGRLDLSVAHSPFGNSFMGENQGPQFFVRNAEINYNFSENSRISFQFRQIPGSMYSPYGYGSPFHSPYRGRHPGSAFDF